MGGTTSTLKGRKRFYKNVGVQEGPSGGFVVQLDGRSVKTPHRNPLEVPTKALAQAVAFEWDRQEHSIEPAAMPLMTLACTAIDIAEARRESTTVELLRYFDTDTILFPGDPEDTDRGLLKLQKQRWRPLVRWMSETYGPVSECHGMMIDPQPAETVAAIAREIGAMNKWQFSGIETLTTGCKSIIIPLAIFRGKITPVEAVYASRVEEEHQVKMWGLVEGGHDVDRANVTAQIAAASVFLKLVSS